MNPLMDVLKKAEDVRPAPAALDADRSSGPDVSEGWRLDPVRTTRDDADPEAAAPGLEPAPLERVLPAGSLSVAVDRESVGNRPGDPPERSATAESVHAVGAVDAAVGRPTLRSSPDPLDVRDPRSTGHRTFDPRTLPRRRGMGRTIGITLSLFAAAGGVAGGGYLFWKTRLARPALVRVLPSMPAVDLAPVHAANAATSTTGEPVAGAGGRPKGHAAVFVPDVAAASPARPATRLSYPQGPEEFRAVSGPAVGYRDGGRHFSQGPEKSRAVPVAGVPASGEAGASLVVPIAGISASGEAGTSQGLAAAKASVSGGSVAAQASDLAERPAWHGSGGSQVASGVQPSALPVLEAREGSRASPMAASPASHGPGGLRLASGVGPSALPVLEAWQGARGSSMATSPVSASPGRDGLAPEPPDSAPSDRHADPTPSHRSADPVPSDRTDRVSVSEEPESAEPRPAGPPAVEPTTGAAAGSFAGTAGHPAPATGRGGVDSRPGPAAGIEIRTRMRADHVAALIERGYEAFRAGDAESAAEAYRAALVHEPRNRDAVLGLAAVAARADRWEEAAGHYARVLASSPADTVARAALIAIDEQDPARGESRLKALLWSEPRAAYLHFSLGNVYAAQSRWPEAQQSYFNAYRFDDGNADYAYNLAVSLDHLSRRERALDFYREALALAQSRPGSFETAAVLARIRDMDASAEEDLASARPLPEPAGTASAENDQ